MRYLKTYKLFESNNTEIGTILSADDIYSYVEGLHRNPEDFEEGDISERIFRNEKYELLEIPLDKICLDEYDLDEDYVDDYIKMYEDTNNYPPIVLDGQTSNYYRGGKFIEMYDIIDGTHRANAIERLGHKNIKAWVGIK